MQISIITTQPQPRQHTTSTRCFSDTHGPPDAALNDFFYFPKPSLP